MAVTADGGTPMRAGPRKVAMVGTLTEKLARATSAVVTDYRGLSVAQIEELRTQLRARGIEYVVVKNTLARRAADEAGVGAFSDVLVGPVGLAIGYDDVAAPAKILRDYFRQTRRLPVVAGLVEGRVFGAEGMAVLADLPAREVLQSQFAGTIQSPLTVFAGALQSVLGQFAGALEARVLQLEAA